MCGVVVRLGSDRLAEQTLGRSGLLGVQGLHGLTDIIRCLRQEGESGNDDRQDHAYSLMRDQASGG